MKVRVNNIFIKDILSLLIEISKYCDIVDMVVDDEERKVILEPIERTALPPSKDIKLTDDNIGDLI